MSQRWPAWLPPVKCPRLLMPPRRPPAPEPMRGSWLMRGRRVRRSRPFIVSLWMPALMITRLDTCRAGSTRKHDRGRRRERQEQLRQKEAHSSTETQLSGGRHTYCSCRWGAARRLMLCLLGDEGWREQQSGRPHHVHKLLGHWQACDRQCGGLGHRLHHKADLLLPAPHKVKLKDDLRQCSAVQGRGQGGPGEDGKEPGGIANACMPASQPASPFDLQYCPLAPTRPPAHPPTHAPHLVIAALLRAVHFDAQGLWVCLAQAAGRRAGRQMGSKAARGKGEPRWGHVPQSLHKRHSPCRSTRSSLPCPPH